MNRDDFSGAEDYYQEYEESSRYDSESNTNSNSQALLRKSFEFNKSLENTQNKIY